MPTSNRLILGDCVSVMQGIDAGCVDFALTDPPYLVRYQDRTGRRVINDDNASWLTPAFTQVYRLLKPDAFCVSFYGWNKVDQFVTAWRAAGFRLGGHLMFRKSYASAERFLRYEHEVAYLLVKGNPGMPARPISDVLDWTYTGNRLHPTQKPVEILRPIIESFCPKAGMVIDPFCGSGSTLVAADQTGRRWIGIELDVAHHATAARRVDGELRAAA